MKKPGLARRGMNLGAIKLAMLLERISEALVDAATPARPNQPRIAVAEMVEWLNYWISAVELDIADAELDRWLAEIEPVIDEAEHAATAGEHLTRDHVRAVQIAQILREFRAALLGNREVFVEKGDDQ